MRDWGESVSERLSGVLLHISSLPSRYGIGDLGPEAHAFARLLAGAGQSCWQFLPTEPTSPAIGNSPYSSSSAFAGNPLFISPDLLVAEGFVSYADLDAALSACGSLGNNEAAVDYNAAHLHRHVLLHTAFERNRQRLDADSGFAAFTARHGYWLEDYVRFVTIKQAHSGAVWTEWPEALRRRDPAALAAWDRQEALALQRERFIQYLFHRQWERLRGLCRELGVRLIGDMPLYVTHDSADVWTNPAFFKLDGNFAPTAVAGVPPDYFSETGQRWGNPVYRWDALKADGFSWWRRRLKHSLTLTDLVRLDHFRGIAGYWEIPAEEETAVNGRWVPAPGRELLAALRREFGMLPLIAEDLGVITPDVRELMREFNLPGMEVLQFGFSGALAENDNAPFHYVRHSVVYSGTHDNAPTRAWFASAGAEEKAALARYTGCAAHEETVHETLMRLALSSAADTAVLPMQDVLGLGAESRMNTPSLSDGNWEWRMRKEAMRPEALRWLAENSAFFGRNRKKGNNGNNV